jgi:hypothetical protein
VDLKLPHERHTGLDVLFDAEEDEILVQKVLELGIVKKLLDQQSATPSAALLMEINQERFVLDFSLRLGVFQGTLYPILSESRGER